MDSILSEHLRLPPSLKWIGPWRYDLYDPSQRGPANGIFLREGPDLFYVSLSPLQQRLTRLFLCLPEAARFALAGRAALVFHRAVPHFTEDLDFFGPEAKEVQPAVEGFLARLIEEDDLRVVMVNSSPTFACLIVRDTAGEEVLVSIGRDGRLRKPETTELGPVLTLEESAADALLALIDRAEARDFVDVYYLARRFGIEAMIEWAGTKDPGFDPYRLALGIGRLESLPRGEFEVGDDVLLEMALFYRALRAELIEETMRPDS